MPSYHLSIKNGKRGKAANHAAYIARQGKHGNHGKQNDLIATECRNLPSWANGDPLLFWKMADAHERVNGAAYRELELALPKELSIEENIALVRDFISAELGNKTTQISFHLPQAAIGNVDQPHVHAMFSDRKPDAIERSPELYFRRHNSAHPELGGCKKDSGGKHKGILKEELKARRETWAQLQNAYLAKNGHSARVDHRSNRERRLELEPERHLGQSGVRRLTDEEKLAYQERRLGNQKLKK